MRTREIMDLLSMYGNGNGSDDDDDDDDDVDDDDHDPFASSKPTGKGKAAARGGGASQAVPVPAWLSSKPLSLLCVRVCMSNDSLMTLLFTSNLGKLIDDIQNKLIAGSVRFVDSPASFPPAVARR